MFERYTEKARRVIFFARYESSQFGSPSIETEHVLLGILREDKALTNRFLRSHSSVEAIRQQIQAHTVIRESISTSVDLPLSDECRHVLAYAAEEAQELGHKHIGTEHLLLGLLREEGCFAAALLRELGVTLPKLREELAKTAVERSPTATGSLRDPFTDLTRLASEGPMHPIVGRDLELDSMVEILGCSRTRNVLLIGERGAGKSAIVERLAQRIAQGSVPAGLADKRVLALKPEVTGWSKEMQRVEEFSSKWRAGEMPTEVILFIDDLAELLAPVAPDGAGMLKRVLSRPGLQCVSTFHARDGAGLEQAMSRLDDCFRAVHVRPLDRESTRSVLLMRKDALESFHGVSYAEEALEFATHFSDSYLSGSALPGKAFELLDAAGSLVKSRQAAPDGEIGDAEKRLREISTRVENAIANHEFEKARYYSEEERKERENLRALKDKSSVVDSIPTVGPDQLKEVISRWMAYPYCQ